MRVEITIPGPPIGKGRARSALRKTSTGGTFIHHYTPEKTEKWESMAAAFIRACARGVTFAGPVRLYFVAVFPRPQRLMAKKHFAGRIPHTSKPDIDNINKALMDAIQKAGLLADDAQIYDVYKRKEYAARNEVAHLYFLLYT